MPYAVWLLFLAVSCNRQPVEGNEPGDQSRQTLAIETQADYSLLTYDRLLDEETDGDFMDETVLAAMASKSVYQYQATLTTKSTAEGVIDTLRTSEEIPFYAEVSEISNIYQDGSFDYVRNMSLDPETNPLLDVYETPFDLNTCVSRLEIKNGKSITYNINGDILSEEDVEMPDYTEYLKMLSQAQDEAGEETRAGVQRDINWLRARMENACPTKVGEEPSWRIYSAPDGNVILEQTMADTKDGQHIMVRTKLSSDISKNYGFEQRINGKLITRSRNIFSDNPATKSTGSPIADISNENPSQTITESLSYDFDGTPKIKVEDKTFSVNRTVLHLK